LLEAMVKLINDGIFFSNPAMNLEENDSYDKTFLLGVNGL